MFRMGQPKLSIILPSLRREMLNRCLQTIETNTFELDYEIIVICPQSVIEGCDYHIRWVEELERAGVCHAVNRGFEAAEGEYVFTLSDESLVKPHCLDNLVRFADAQAENVICAPTVIPHSQLVYFGRPFATFPLLRKSLIKKLGCFFDENYKCFFADPDLSLRVHELGGGVMECPTAEIYSPHYNDEVHALNVKKYLDQDQDYFIQRWKHLMGPK
jgi:GT2 family glycosyltransferase